MLLRQQPRVQSQGRAGAAPGGHRAAAYREQLGAAHEAHDLGLEPLALSLCPGGQRAVVPVELEGAHDFLARLHGRAGLLLWPGDRGVLGAQGLGRGLGDHVVVPETLDPLDHGRLELKVARQAVDAEVVVADEHGQLRARAPGQRHVPHALQQVLRRHLVGARRAPPLAAERAGGLALEHGQRLLNACARAARAAGVVDLAGVDQPVHVAEHEAVPGVAQRLGVRHRAQPRAAFVLPGDERLGVLPEPQVQRRGAAHWPLPLSPEQLLPELGRCPVGAQTERGRDVAAPDSEGPAGPARCLAVLGARGLLCGGHGAAAAQVVLIHGDLIEWWRRQLSLLIELVQSIIEFMVHSTTTPSTLTSRGSQAWPGGRWPTRCQLPAVPALL